MHILKIHFNDGTCWEQKYLDDFECARDKVNIENAMEQRKATYQFLFGNPANKVIGIKSIKHVEIGYRMR